ncbi:MAG TPA: CotH kinase family protein, partial [Polyangiales bacterium]|nr:CotH kinase family protein [Polyangiales bacterium]
GAGSNAPAGASGGLASSSGIASAAAGGGGGVAVAAITPTPSDAADYLFDQTALRTYDITIAQADLDTINANPAAEAWVPATLQFEGKSYGPYEVRYKGSAGSFMYPCTMGAAGGPKYGKCSIKLGFNEVDSSARFFGLKKVNLHAMNPDASMLRERLAYKMFRDNGVPAPRVAHARVLINGQLEGLFALVEEIDELFTRGRFSEGGQGNLYKEIWPLYDDPMRYVTALENNSSHPDVSRMVDFKQAVATSADATATFIDRDYTLRYLAVDRVIINDDGIFHFWCDPTAEGNNTGGLSGNHNYYWYETAAGDRFFLIPWDLDNTFDTSPLVHLDPEWTASAPCVCNNNPMFGIQEPSSCDPLAQHFISWLDDYNSHVDAFLAGAFAKASIDPLLTDWSNQIQAAVIESAGLNEAPTEAQWADGVTTLRSKIDSARQHRGYAY